MTCLLLESVLRKHKKNMSTQMHHLYRKLCYCKYYLKDAKGFVDIFYLVCKIRVNIYNLQESGKFMIGKKYIYILLTLMFTI